MTIYFDLDGVLANFEGYIKEHNIFYVPHETRDKAADAHMWEEIKKVDRFYFQLEPMPGSLELFRRLNEKYHCEILSAIPKPHWGLVGTEEDKREWVAKYLGEDVKVNIVYREQKKDFAKGPQSVLVDDYEKNIRAWEEFGGTGILFRSAEDFDESVIEKLL
jgi:5'(3')-deoxyribonucleotidase